MASVTPSPRLTWKELRVQVKAIGVCNYNMQQLEEALEVAAQHGIPLASNQVDPTLLLPRA